MSNDDAFILWTVMRCDILFNDKIELSFILKTRALIVYQINEKMTDYAKMMCRLLFQHSL